MSTIEQTETAIKQKRDEFNRRLGEAQSINAHKKETEANIESLKSTIETLGKVAFVLHSLANAVQEKFLNGIENLVSEGLSAVFEEPIKFKITPTVRNKQVNLDFTILNEDGTETDLMDARGGGLVCLTGVLLRIIMARLMASKVRQVIVLDEPLGMLSSGYQPQAGELLKRLATELNMQLIMVTHNPEIIEHADKVYKLQRTAEGVKAIDAT